MAFPAKKQRFWTIFVSAPKAPPLKNAKFYFYCRPAVSEILFISHDTVWCLCLWGIAVSHNYSAICCKMEYRQMCMCETKQQGGGVARFWGGALASLKMCRTTRGIAATVSLYRAASLSFFFLVFSKIPRKTSKTAKVFLTLRTLKNP